MEESRLIFLNIANGVPIIKLMQDFQKSEKEIMEILAFVASKIKNYTFKRGMPFIKCEVIEDIKNNKMRLLSIIDMLDLNKPIEFKVTSQDCDLKNLKGVL